MSTYRKYDWPNLIKQFHDSGMNQTQFCKQQNLNPKYFNLKLNKQRKAKSSDFVLLKTRATDEESSTHGGIILTIGGCVINCPANIAVGTIAELAKSLA